MVEGTPIGDASRQAELARYGVLDSEPEESFDELAQLAAHVCAAPMAVVDFVDGRAESSRPRTCSPSAMPSPTRSSGRRWW
jgi:hypothetical protein